MNVTAKVTIAPKNGKEFTKQTPDREGFINFIKGCRIASVEIERE